MMYPLFSPSGFSLFALRAQVLLVALGFMACLPLAQADMIIETTRVIYPESKREVSFKVSNVSKERPAFVQMWLDDGNAAAAPEDAITPFNLTPPVAKLKADSNQVVRLVFTGEPLPADRESVFWFNMLELPQKSTAENKLSFAVRTRIKVFYRPKALKGDPTEYMDKVSWNVRQKDGNWVAEGTNPSPFNMSFFSLNFGEKGKFDLSVDGGMIPPKGSASFVIGAVDKVPPSFSAIKVDFINDYGGVNAKEFPIAVRN
jgi:chaperone protein EcpD